MSEKTDRDVRLVERKVTYHVEIEGKLAIVRDVPARVNVETGERVFSPETVERLQALIRGPQLPVRTIETPVYQYG